jgi:hypothetical protein
MSAQWIVHVTCAFHITTKYTMLGKGKAITLKALKGPESSRRLRLPDFNTFTASYLNTQV